MTRRKTDRRRRALLADADKAIRERHGEFDLGLAEIAEDAGCSTRQLQRVFREIGGTDFRTRLLEVRMDHARRLLSRKKGGLSVRAAARQVGYREASGLRQALKRFSDEKPSDLHTEPPDINEEWRRAEQASDAD